MAFLCGSYNPPDWKLELIRGREGEREREISIMYAYVLEVLNLVRRIEALPSKPLTKMLCE